MGTQNRAAATRTYTNRTNTNRTNTNRANQNITYLYGSTAPKVEVTPQRRPQRELERRNVPNTRPRTRVQAKPSPVNVPLLVLSLIAFVISGALMIKYISLNSEITALAQGIETLESQINTLKTENDEYYSRIMSSIDLEEVREVAIMDLGMVYASEGQIITYDSKIDDYVEQSRVIKD